MQRVIYFTLLAAAIVTSALAGPEQKSRFWSKGWSYHPIDPDWSEHRALMNSLTCHGDELYGDIMFTNVVDNGKVPPPVTIRGSQMPDGSFWPFIELQVGPDSKGPWKTIASIHRDGTELSLTVPASITVAGLRADLRPFLPFIDSMRWGRVVLQTGDASVVELKELRESK
jgi:hypothetical protein